jgi:hypothetical protein
MPYRMALILSESIKFLQTLQSMDADPNIAALNYFVLTNKILWLPAQISVS